MTEREWKLRQLINDVYDELLDRVTPISDIADRIELSGVLGSVPDWAELPVQCVAALAYFGAAAGGQDPAFDINQYRDEIKRSDIENEFLRLENAKLTMRVKALMEHDAYQKVDYVPAEEEVPYYDDWRYD